MSQGAGVASSQKTGAVWSNNTGAAAARILDVGCGINKYPGSIGVDRNANTRADVLCDLERVQQVEVEHQEHRFYLRSQLTGTAGRVFQAAGVAAPPTVQQVD